ncbi:MAG TPA: glycosyltransferase family 2 protein [Clostridia bacterium]|nr:glycosyltransferase family 2 protein [Clostridia bacterium]
MGNRPMASDWKIGVVTVTYNSAGVLPGFLRSMAGQTWGNYTLYVVDNASKDGSAELAGTCSNVPVLVIGNDDNRGVAAGNNQGIHAAFADGCDAILLINNDTEFEPGLMAKLADSMAQQGCDMIIPKMMYFEPKDTIWCAGGWINPWRGYSGEHYGMRERDCGQFDAPRQVTYAPTCCMLVRKSVFERIGYMDERYFVYFDDTDFCYRAKQAGLVLNYEPAVTLYHKVSSLTGGDESSFAVRYITRNHVYYLLKNFGRLLAVVLLFGYALKITAKLLMRTCSLQLFTTASSAFIEGVRVFVASRRERREPETTEVLADIK